MGQHAGADMTEASLKANVKLEGDFKNMVAPMKVASLNCTYAATRRIRPDIQIAGTH